jgi:hypothetical protein
MPSLVAMKEFRADFRAHDATASMRRLRARTDVRSRAYLGALS